MNELIPPHVEMVQFETTEELIKLYEFYTKHTDIENRLVLRKVILQELEDRVMSLPLLNSEPEEGLKGHSDV